jgi:hypothetical protein
MSLLPHIPADVATLPRAAGRISEALEIRFAAPRTARIAT